MRSTVRIGVLSFFALLLGVSVGVARESASFHFTLAKVFAAEGSYPEAIQSFKKAIDLEPEDAYLRMEYAEFLSRTGRLRQATEEADRALELAPENTDALRLAGHIRLDLASRDPRSLAVAKTVFERLRRIDPSDTASMLTLSQIYLNEGDASTALDVAEEASGYGPNDPRIHRMLLQALVRSGDDDRALVLLPEILRLDPTFVEGRVALARIFSARGEHNEAVQLLEGAPPDRSDDGDTDYLLAVELYRRAASGGSTRASQLEDLARASVVVEEILDQQPTHLEALFLRGQILAGESRRVEAIEVLRSLNEVAPEDLRLRVVTRLAELLEQEGEVVEAADLLSSLAEELNAGGSKGRVADRVWLEVARLHGRHEEWSDLLAASERLMAASAPRLRVEGALFAAEALQRMERAREAVQLLRRFEDEVEESTPLTLKRAEILLDLGETVESARILDRVMASGEVSALLAVAQFHLRQQNHEEVVVVLGELLDAEEVDLDPVLRREVLFLRADSYVEVDNAEGALASLAAEAELFGQGSDLDKQRLLLKRAEILEELDRDGEAQALLDGLAAQGEAQPALLLVQYYQRDSRFEAMVPVLELALEGEGEAEDSLALVDLHFSLGMAYERLGRWNDATTEFQRVLAVDPEDGRTLNYLGYMWADQGESLEEAVELIERALDLEPDNGAYIDSLGWALFKMGRYAEARELLEKAAKLMSEDATILEHLGDVYVALDIPQKAKELYTRALAIDDENVEGIRRKLARLRVGGS